MQDKGLPLHHDMFSSGKVAHGCGHSVRTVYKGIRTTGADFLHSHPSNLHILTETLVDKVIIEGEGEQQRASSVVGITSSGARLTLQASKDIVISCGTYCTPTILMRSGIGASEELAAAGIEVKSGLAGVGKNLMDHLVRLQSFYQTYDHQLTMYMLDRFYLLRGEGSRSNDRSPALSWGQSSRVLSPVEGRASRRACELPFWRFRIRPS